MLKKASIITIMGLILVSCGPKPQQLGLSPEEWSTFSSAEQQQLWKQYKQVSKATETFEKVYEGPEIRVYLAQGSAAMPPFTKRYPFETFYFKIKPGQCLNVPLSSIDTEKRVAMEACYDGLTLSLDPSRYKTSGEKGTVHFDFNPIWQRGFTYSGVNSDGYVRLRDVAVTIKSIPDVAPVKDAKPVSL